MTKQIQVPNDVYENLCDIAESLGHPVKVGRGSGLVWTLREMCNAFKPIRCGDADEAWLRFFTRIMPAISDLMLEAIRHHERADSESNSKGVFIRRIYL